MNMKTFAFLLLTALPALASAGASGEAAKPEVELQKLSIDEVSAKLASKDPVFVYDNNTEERYAKGHVPGATWVKYDGVEEKDLPKDKTATLVFYCANEKCMACHKAASQAMKLGYKNVYIMPAGIMGWEKAEKPVEHSEVRG